MVAVPSCVLQRWFALESCDDGYAGSTTGAVGTVTAAGWERTTRSELQDCDSGNSGRCADTSCNNSFIHVLGKPSHFAGDEASWKSWSFVMLSFSEAVSLELRALMEKGHMTNVNLTPSEGAERARG